MIKVTFSEQLNLYLEEYHLSASTLARYSGISVSAVARYKSGEREPAYDSEQILKIAKGLFLYAKEQGFAVTEEELLTTLRVTVSDGLSVDYDTYIANLNILLKALDIRVTPLARSLSFDPSHVSKILSGQRRPGHIYDFTQKIASYISRHYADEQNIKALSSLMSIPVSDLNTPRAVSETVASWLGTNTVRKENDPVGHFLDKLDDFNLNEFINTIRFNDIKVPTAPFLLPTTKTYTGIDEMMESELDFIKATVLSKSRESCILYSDMPLEDMAKDPEFPKKYMFGLAMMLKKGLHLHLIHDVNRPFHEMMLGLEGNIPLYMTGQISPYYLSSPQGGVFNHLLKVSGAAALEGHAISGHQKDGKYTLYKAKDDVQHYRLRAKHLLSQALPLMDIYRSDRKEAYHETLHKLLQKDDRQITYSSLPIYTVSEKLLSQILSRSRIGKKASAQILAFREEYRAAVEKLLEQHRILITVPDLTAEQFAASPLNLALSEIFFETDIPYLYEEYNAHLHETEEFAEKHENLTVTRDPTPTFRNITYSVIGNQQVIVSKNKYPTIHFVIHHKKMVQAFRNFIPPIKEEQNEKKKLQTEQ
ncbi:MAG: helix-turn-helix transcriptional regulator [Ruminococcus sp.]|nr:helix-turn-helix transcriptional regulator [Ruminococcus sp.]